MEIKTQVVPRPVWSNTCTIPLSSDVEFSLGLFRAVLPLNVHNFYVLSAITMSSEDYNVPRTVYVITSYTMVVILAIIMSLILYLLDFYV